MPEQIGINQAKRIFEENSSSFIGELSEFLRFPSIGVDPAHGNDCRSCAAWLRDVLAGAGLDARLLETGLQPAVYAERRGRPDKPTILFYGHYDVQPTDPAGEWETQPFEPVIKNGRIYARGASDDKGQVFYVIKAVEQLVRLNALNASLRVLIEGGEESGSLGISRNLDKWRQLLKADVLMVCDTGLSPDGAPALIIGLRGLIHATVELFGPKHDLHSGMHGGVAPNPADAIAKLIAGLHDEHGRIAVEGFYDGIKPPTEREREIARGLIFDEAGYVEETGVRPLAGEISFSPNERLAFRPSLDVNGIHSGYGGPGSKTIIPSKASAKITCRLAAGQNPERCLSLLIKHLESKAPAGMALKVAESGCAGPGFRLDPDSPIAKRTVEILNSVSDKPAKMMWNGASIPIIAELARVSGAEPVIAGFSSEEDSIHAPNESFSIENFRMGFEYAMKFLSSF